MNYDIGSMILGMGVLIFIIGIIALLKGGISQHKRKKKTRTKSKTIVLHPENWTIFKINWVNFFIIIISAVILGFIGMSLPPTITRLNLNNVFYGTWASYFIAILLFFLLNMDRDLSYHKKKGRKK